MANTEIAQEALFVNGAWIDGGRSTRFILDPATEKPIAAMTCASEADLSDACEAAAQAFEKWSRVPAVERAAIMRRAAALLLEQRLAIARRLTICQGKRFAEALMEVDDSADILEWSGAEARRLYGRVVPSPIEDISIKVLVQPLGPVAVFTPWNFPLGEVVTHCAAAIGAGCTVVLKPAGETPLPAVDFVRIMQEAGLPDGVLNLVYGNAEQISKHVIGDRRICKIAFTGSVSVGRTLGLAAAERIIPTTLELGGNAPVIVGSDFNAEQAAAIIVKRKLRNAGQVCTSPTRFFVPAEKSEEFVAASSAIINDVVLGHGLEDKTSMGPLNNQRQVAAMKRFLDDAAGRQATIIRSSSEMPDAGYFCPPVIVTDLAEDALLTHQEVFGPIIPIIPYKNLDEAIAMANSTPEGLSAYAFTNDPAIRARLERELLVGTLSINHGIAQFVEAPFGGVKETGYGRVGGMEGLRSYTRTKVVSERY
ncbi:aldehyde dehydrogenase family protein [Agrobacterium tumefaciens]|uniref:aldehyde dehydrogenase family protein n=1 Tax=Agrobacterium tumefaciens TaxID=358 RepID=UPI001573D891|nr:aldehyde dehydrogenase family protein [Agrobacterium tumefaciens]NTE68279.1 aldehyde dehydrogenase family protein [Agrobacterium tumefaciens]